MQDNPRSLHVPLKLFLLYSRLPLFPVNVDERDSVWPYRIQVQAEGIIMPEETRRDWETIQEDAKLVTQRLKVQDGWLYRVVNTYGAISLTFAPNPKP